mmetsp:Transcript_56139/g.162624  ORF Transcript_56139/g.162624 Transcript_56139/m.162624 type:complete len:299 (+) Transcript_56139:800-1696(+)
MDRGSVPPGLHGVQQGARRCKVFRQPLRGADARVRQPPRARERAAPVEERARLRPGHWPTECGFGSRPHLLRRYVQRHAGAEARLVVAQYKRLRRRPATSGGDPAARESNTALVRSPGARIPRGPLGRAAAGLVGRELLRGLLDLGAVGDGLGLGVAVGGAGQPAHRHLESGVDGGHAGGDDRPQYVELGVRHPRRRRRALREALPRRQPIVRVPPVQREQDARDERHHRRRSIAATPLGEIGGGRAVVGDGVEKHGRHRQPPRGRAAGLTVSPRRRYGLAALDHARNSGLPRVSALL